MFTSAEVTRMNSSVGRSYRSLEPDLKDGKPETDDEYAKRVGINPYSPSAGVAICLNYIIGTGCVGLPFALTQCGLGLTLLLLLLGAGFAFISNNFTLEAMARAQGVEDTRDVPRNRITYEKHSFAAIASRFGGSSARTAVQLSVLTYCLGSLWSYASVFSSSVSSLFFSYVFGIPCNVYEAGATRSCLASYDVCMVVFGVIVISLSLKNIADQIGVQQFLTLYRVFAFGLMFVTMGLKMYVEGGEVLSARLSHIWGFQWGKFGRGFGPLFLALTFQYNLPDALQALRNKDQAQVLTSISSGISLVLYLLLAVMGALAFDDVNPLITLNWHEFTGCGEGGWRPCSAALQEKQPWLGVIVQTLVMIFPIFAVVSSFPMVAITMADNLISAVPLSITSRYSPGTISSWVRFASAFPPLVLATFFKHLDTILTVAGLFGFVLSYVVPGALQAISVTYCRNRWGEKGVLTPYSWCTNDAVITTYVVLSLLLTLTGFYTTFS